MKPIRVFLERPANLLNVEEADRVDLDEALFPEDSWEGDLEEGEFEVEKSCRCTIRSKDTLWSSASLIFSTLEGYSDPSWTDEADLNCGAILEEFDRNRISRNRFMVMQSNEKGSWE